MNLPVIWVLGWVLHVVSDFGVFGGIFSYLHKYWGKIFLLGNLGEDTDICERGQKLALVRDVPEWLIRWGVSQEGDTALEQKYTERGIQTSLGLIESWCVCWTYTQMTSLSFEQL